MKPIVYAVALRNCSGSSATISEFGIDENGKPLWGGQAQVSLEHTPDLGEAKKKLAEKLRALADAVETD
jgi:hypothetical protein